MLNPALDPRALAAAYRARSRLQVREVLKSRTAAALHAFLANDVPWSFTCRAGGGNRLLSPEQLAAMTAAERSSMGLAILEQARSDFAFGFMTFPMLRHYLDGADRSFPLDRLYEALSGPEFLGFVRAVTGDESIRAVDAQATRYTAGHFLTLHDDSDRADGDRRCAYVLNLTDAWRAEWGGLLHFVDEDGGVSETFVPHFNSLSLFRVPTRHIVSYVAPYAVRPRLSITGWFLA